MYPLWLQPEALGLDSAFVRLKLLKLLNNRGQALSCERSKKKGPPERKLKKEKEEREQEKRKRKEKGEKEEKGKKLVLM